MAKRRKYSEDIDVERESFKIQDPITYGTPIQKCKLDIKFKNPNQKKFALLLEENVITICSGNAGTGKTFLACYDAIKRLKSGETNKIILVKSVQQVETESVGFVKGSLEEKLQPFIYSFKQNFYDLIGKTITDQLFETNVIEVAPIAFMRGLTFKNAVIIIDEVQNLTVQSIRTVMTRLGEGSRMIILGDENQIDIRNKSDSCLKFIVDTMSTIDGVGTMRFELNDIVRHPMIIKIEEVFGSYTTWKDQSLVGGQTKK